MSDKFADITRKAVQNDFELAKCGDRSALARTLSSVEKGGVFADTVHRQLKGIPADSYTIGITGAPGAGKSTLVGALIKAIRAEDQRIAVVAIDPSSPFSRGALLGDRLRMRAGKLDEGIFIRSMASRGSLGGLATSTQAAANVLMECGWPWVIIETVGAGQTELDIAGIADMTIVVLNPGWGDEIQAHKAGMMEIGDLFVINKADKPGVMETRRDVEMMLAGKTSNAPQVLETVAVEGQGVEALLDAIKQHKQAQMSSGDLNERRVKRMVYSLKSAIKVFYEKELNGICESEEFEQEIMLLADGKTTLPDSVAKLLRLPLA